MNNKLVCPTNFNPVVSTIHHMIWQTVKLSPVDSFTNGGYVLAWFLNDPYRFVLSHYEWIKIIPFLVKKITCGVPYHTKAGVTVGGKRCWETRIKLLCNNNKHSQLFSGFKVTLVYQHGDKMPITRNQSAISFWFNGVKLAIPCSLFVILWLWTGINCWKAQTCCCLLLICCSLYKE